ncbi:MAG: carbohydrate-binding domain-containing protein [Lachnospiraceae bacterium]|nr:carbohydrate-binding domain-containing protein [Lachnospiraceae bacterium]
MKYSERKISFLICSMILTGVFSGCSNSKDLASEEAAIIKDAVVSDDSGDITADKNAALQEVLSEETVLPVDMTDAVRITLSNEKIDISGNGAELHDNAITITRGGTYLVTGEIADGRLIIDAEDEEVTLVLENAAISCSDTSPLYIYQSKMTTLYLMENSINTLTDGSPYSFADSYSSEEEEEPNACLYSKSDLVIAGSGELEVNGEYKNGITSKDTLKIKSAKINVKAINHGITGKDSCVLKDADVNIDAGGDGLRATNDKDDSLGNIVMVDTVLKVDSGEDGIQAENTLIIQGGNVTICSGGGNTQSVADGNSAKGLKGINGIYLYDGTFQLDCADDAVHSNGNILITEGEYTISSADDGIHADQNAKVTGGTIDIQKSYEGIEGASVDIAGGNISIVADDDGINAAGGADQSGFGPRQDAFAEGSDYYILISGGKIVVDADGDGVDANGSLTVSGGELYISGSTNDGNGALDYDGKAVITGGTVIAAGASGMTQNFGEESTQGSILLSFPESSEEEICIKDEAGNTLASYAPMKSYNCVVISCPSIAVGNTYTVEACGQSVSVTMSNLIYGNSSGMGGGGRKGGGMGRPDVNMELPEGMERPEKGEMREGMEPPERMERPEK